MDGYRCFTFDRKRFPDPARFMADLRQDGFKVVTILDPGIKVDPEYPVYKSGLAGDHFIEYPDGERYTGDVWPGPCHFADFTRPETRSWWGELHRQLLEWGVAGIWNDMNEPAVWGEEVPHLVEFRENGKPVSIKKIHNVFGHLEAQAADEGLRRLQPDQRPFILTRAGFSGTQRHAAMWTGDNVSSFADMEMQIRLCLSLGLSGYAFVGADAGGFHGAPTPELMVRWFQFGAFTPLFRGHADNVSPRKEPWAFGRPVEDLIRRSIELRYRMLPYTYSVFQQATATGLPIMRPLFMEFPAEPETFQAVNRTAFLWGENILVAPVTAEGQRLRKVYLPEGQWYDFWEPKTYAGGGYQNVDAPLDKLPLFVRAGSVIALREVQQYVDEKPLIELELHVYPGAGRMTELYEDDGRSLAYEKGVWCKTEFSLQNTGGELRLNISARKGTYLPHSRDYRIVFHAQTAMPKQILLDNAEIPLAKVPFDAKAGTVEWKMKDEGTARNIVVRL
jgi:alpha-glucosidase